MNQGPKLWVQQLKSKVEQLFAQKKDKKPVYVVGPLATAIPKEIGQSDFVIFVDGGARLKSGSPTKNILSVGDADSANASLLDVVFPKEKDHSDLALILDSLLPIDSNFSLFGFSGERIDHELFNLGEVHHFLNHKTVPTKLTIEPFINFLSAGAWVFKHEGLFSLGTIVPNKVAVSGDCKYKMTASKLLNPLSSFGLSNEAFGIVIVTAEAPLFVYSQVAISISEV